MAPKIAVVGGGLAGTTCARTMQSLGLQVVLFDQGQRGFGGRTSHRSNQIGLSVDRFDHGCQFFYASSPRFSEIVREWVGAGVVGDWKHRRVLWSTSADVVGPSPLGQGSRPRDFFGALENQQSPCFVGIGGMHNIARFQASVAESSGATLSPATRVVDVQKVREQWHLLGTSGLAAFHNTPEAAAGEATAASLGTFDAVIFTDASSSQQKWHRASAGAADIAPAMAAWIAARPRLPLFTAMLIIPAGGPCSDHDAIVFDKGPVWYACRNSAKPGFGMGGENPDNGRESWTIVSTPEFACQEIAAVPMCEQGDSPEKKTFRPQEDSYLNAPGVGPADVLARFFLEAVQGPPVASESATPWLYLQGQRWGSAVPGSLDAATSEVVEIASTLYQRTIPHLSPREPVEDGKDFLYDDAQRIFYCGDFCSRRVAGVEAAVLSGEDCGRHVAKLLLSGDK